eukprot:Sspe_Gene.9358::Locus_3143_Transcript_5_5_Confidence_0.429_Length_4671::g.9358::m.9358
MITMCLAVLVASLATFLPFSHAQEPGLVLDGYDVVAYFSLSANATGVQGNPHYVEIYEDYVFYFASQENAAAFRANPLKYLPQYGGFCAWGTAYEYPNSPPSPHAGYPWLVNKTVTCLGPPCNPATGWAVHDGKLYCSIGPIYMAKFLDEAPQSIALADKRWQGWFGGPTNSPPINIDCTHSLWNKSCQARMLKRGCCQLGDCYQ